MPIAEQLSYSAIDRLYTIGLAKYSYLDYEVSVVSIQ